MTHQPPDPSVPAPLSAEWWRPFAAALEEKAWWEDAHGEVVLLSDATDAIQEALDAERQARAADPREAGLREALRQFRAEYPRADVVPLALVEAALAATPARAAAPAMGVEEMVRVQRAMSEPAGLPLDAADIDFEQMAADYGGISSAEFDAKYPDWHSRPEVMVGLRAALASPATSQGTGEEER